MNDRVLSIKSIPQVSLQIIKPQTQTLIPGILLAQITNNLAINLAASHSTYDKGHAPGASIGDELVSSLYQFARLDMILLPLLSRQLFQNGYKLVLRKCVTGEMNVLVLGVVVRGRINEEVSHGSRDIGTSASGEGTLSTVNDSGLLLVEIESKEAIQQALRLKSASSYLTSRRHTTYVFYPRIANYGSPANRILLRFQVFHKLPLVRGNAYIVEWMVCANSIV